MDGLKVFVPVDYLAREPLVKVVFKGKDDRELGSESYSDINEVLIPAYDEDGPELYIKKKFMSEPDVVDWKIYSLEEKDGSLVEIKLVEARHFQSLSRYAKSQGRRINKCIGQFNIVDVDFGFYSNVMSKVNRSSSKNTEYTEARLNGELHKKRPCVVWSVDDRDQIRVIPLTTNGHGAEKSNKLELNPESFDNFSEHYRQKSSYALVQLIQTVSASRVFPPMEKGRSGAANAYRKFKLCTSDRRQLVEAVAREHVESLQIEKKILQKRFDDLQKEKSRIVARNRELKSELEGWGAMAIDLADFLEVEDTKEAIEKAIKGLS